MHGTLPALIFDLDGTLTDSKPGILSCLGKVLHAWNIRDPGPLDSFIGPPVEEWAVQLLPEGSDEARGKLASDYRSCYDREGWSNNSVFPGVREVLVDLYKEGYPLNVCTSKQHHFAVRILELFELSNFFIAIYGDKSEYPTHSKTDLLALLLHEQALQPSSTWMIGDRIHDFEAARANGVRALAAAWGYGTPEEWALADATASSPGDLPAVLAGSKTSRLPSF